MKVSGISFVFNDTKKYSTPLRSKKMVRLTRTERDTFIEFLNAAIRKDKLNEIEKEDA